MKVVQALLIGQNTKKENKFASNVIQSQIVILCIIIFKIFSAYREIVDCYYIKTAKICGLNAAKIIKDLMKHVIDVIITTTCDISANPYVADPMPESAVQQKV